MVNPVNQSGAVQDILSAKKTQQSAPEPEKKQESPKREEPVDQVSISAEAQKLAQAEKAEEQAARKDAQDAREKLEQEQDATLSSDEEQLDRLA